MGIFGWLLQLKYTSANASPFVTDYVTIQMFIVAFFLYFGSLTVKLLAHAPNTDMGEFINNITFLFGTLSSVWPLLILVRAFGLLVLLLWTIYLVRDVATKKSYRNAVRDVFNIVKEMIISRQVWRLMMYNPNHRHISSYKSKKQENRMLFDETEGRHFKRTNNSEGSRQIVVSQSSLSCILSF